MSGRGSATGRVYRVGRGPLPCAVRPAYSGTIATTLRDVVDAWRERGENVGMVARAMLNTGLTELRLVAPRDGWPNPKPTKCRGATC